MSNNTIRQVIILGALAIIGIMTVQSYWVLRSWDLKEEEFNQAVYIALQNVAKDLAKLNESVLPSQNLILQRATNYFEVNINDVIDANTLQYYLQKEFEDAALNVDFEYFIYDCSSKKMVYGDYISYSNDEEKEIKAEDVPRINDEFIYYFGVRFPGKSSAVISQMRLSIVFSIILLIAILFFMYSIFIILRQKRLSEMQKDFINNMTHEFKTPISTIKISADVFLNNPIIQEDKRLHRYASIIKEQNHRLNNQVEKVLQLARIERESFSLNKEKIDVHELLENIVQNAEIKLTEKSGTISCFLEAKRAIVEADRLHLTNVLDNLVDNAIKYCKDKPEITLITADYGNQINLSISDNGIGILPEHQGKVFNKFYRVPTGNVHNVKGFGLGLFYIKNICDAHGWRLRLKSTPDVGTTITMSINRQL